MVPLISRTNTRQEETLYNAKDAVGHTMLQGENPSTPTQPLVKVQNTPSIAGSRWNHVG